MPEWYHVLEMAREWKVPPWEIAGGAKVIWYLRQKRLKQIERTAKKS